MKSKQVQLSVSVKTKKDEKLQFGGRKEAGKSELTTLVQSIKKKAKTMHK